MRSVARFIVVLIAALSSTACMTSKPFLYDVALAGVERPVDAKQRYGEVQITRQDTEGVGQYTFEDQLVKIAWIFSAQQAHFQLYNKTEHSMKIVWDDAAFVDQLGESHRVMHAGIKYTDKEAPQPPTVVVRGGTVSDLVYPTSHVSWLYSDWYARPILIPDATRFGSLKYTLEDAQDNIGSVVQILLPLEVQGVVNEYHFVFKVNDVTKGT